MNALNVLIISNNLEQVALITHTIQKAGFTLYPEVIQQTNQLRILQQHWHMILADFTSNAYVSFVALKQLQSSHHSIPFIIITDRDNEDRAVQAMKAGAQDYIIADDLKRLIPAIERELNGQMHRATRAKEDQAMRHYAYHDALTDLPNRLLMSDRLQQALHCAKRQNTQVGVLFLDLNKFKAVNDRMGHHAGDILLQQVGRRLSALLRQTDTIARLGGDEFAIVLANTSATSVHKTCEKVLRMLTTPFNVHDKQVSIGASIGVAFYPDHGESTDALLDKADAAMYYAKHHQLGVTFYSHTLEKYTLQQHTIVNELQHAIEHDELTLSYQPTVDLSTGKITCVEALLRWPHNERGMLFPECFIPLAEESELMQPLTAWVIKHALKQCHEWLNHGFNVPLSINISAANLVDDDGLFDCILQTLHQYHLKPQHLMLELTENAMMPHPINTMKLMTKLSQVGIFFMIDDFGTGYSSLLQLKQLQTNGIKIDKSFTQGIATDEQNTDIISAAINMAHQLGIKVIAEGVEDQSTWHVLQSLECDMAQGYHICPPISEDEVLDRFEWIRQHPSDFSAASTH